MPVAQRQWDTSNRGCEVRSRRIAAPRGSKREARRPTTCYCGPLAPIRLGSGARKATSVATAPSVTCRVASCLTRAATIRRLNRLLVDNQAPRTLELGPRISARGVRSRTRQLFELKCLQSNNWRPASISPPGSHLRAKAPAIRFMPTQPMGGDLAFIVRVLRSRSTTGNAEPELISSRPTLTWRSCGAGGRLQAGTSQGSASRESDALVLRRATLPRATCRGPIPRAISPLGTFGAMRFCKFGLVLRLRRFSWREKYHGIYARVPSISGATPIELR